MDWAEEGYMPELNGMRDMCLRFFSHAPSLWRRCQGMGMSRKWIKSATAVNSLSAVESERWTRIGVRSEESRLPDWTGALQYCIIGHGFYIYA